MADNFPSLSAAQKLKGWDTKLRMEETPDDIFGYTPEDGGIFRGQRLPDNSVIAKNVATGGKGTETLSLLKDLSGAGRRGSQAKNVVGFEEKQVTMEKRVYADELAHAVPHEEFGKDAFERAPYNFYSTITKSLGKWHRKNRGVRIRQAMAEGYDGVLVGATNQNALAATVAYPHTNIFVMGQAIPSQPAFSATIATYAGAVHDAAAGVADVTLARLDALSEWASSIRPIQGINVAGAEKWILTLPPRTVTILRSLMRDIWKETDAIRALGHTGLGEYGNFLLVEDSRSPRVKIVDDVSITHSYFGVSDDREPTGTGVHDVGFLLGSAAIIEYQMEALHFATEVQQYERNKGIAAFSTTGFNRLDWDADLTTPADGRKNFSSAEVLFKAS